MKRKFVIPVEVAAFTQAEAQAKIDVLMQIGSYFKSFTTKDLLYSVAGHFMVQKLGEFGKKQTAEPK